MKTWTEREQSRQKHHAIQSNIGWIVTFFVVFFVFFKRIVPSVHIEKHLSVLILLDQLKEKTQLYYDDVLAIRGIYLFCSH